MSNYNPEDREALEAKITSLEQNLSSIKKRLSDANDVIYWIQTSNFWKLRSAWLYLKNLVTRTAETDLMSSYLESSHIYQEKIQNSAIIKLSNFHQENIDSPAILFISHEASRTGAPIFLINAAKYLKENLNVECIFLLQRDGEIISKFQEIGETFVLNHSDFINHKVINYLKKRNIKLIYSNTATNGKIQKELKFLNIPILCHVHELEYSLEQFFSGDNLKEVLSTTDLFLAGSGTVADYLIHKKGVTREKVTIAYPFIDVNLNFSCKNQDLLTNSPIYQDNKTIIVGACGTICWRKGADLFIQVVKYVLSKTEAKVHFVWVGGIHDSNYYNNLLYDATVMGISRNLSFSGAVTNHLRILQQFDIFLLPSREDPFPLVMLDSASLEIPIVCFDKSGGAREFVEEDSGYIVPYMDIESMSNAVVQLIEDKSLRRDLGQSAFRKVLNRHDISVGGKHLTSIVKPYICN